MTSLPIAGAPRAVPRYVLISAWSVPVLVVGQFSMLAIVPVALLVAGVLRSPTLQALRPYVGVLAALYATPLAIWILRSDPAQSLSKDMHPAFIALIAAAAVPVIWKLHSRQR